MPHSWIVPRQKFRLFLEVLADVPARRRVVVNEVHKCQRGVSGNDIVDLRFPRANHAAQREGRDTFKQASILGADIFQISRREGLVWVAGCELRQVTDYVAFIDHSTLSDSLENLVQHA